MQVPSSNHSTSTSRRSNMKRKATIASWFDGFIDKACCAAVGYTAGDEVLDDNSIAYSEHTNTNESHICASSARSYDSVAFPTADDSIQWMLDGKLGVRSYEYRGDFEARAQGTNVPLSPRSDATATTVLTGSSNSSRGISPRAPPVPTSKVTERAHSTGTMRRPEDEWRQQDAEQRRTKTKADQKKKCPREVLIPIDWQHEHGMRRTHSETLPKLPFPTVQPQQRVYNRSYN